MASIRSRIGENMEDRYLFKAKRVDNGEWEIGNLIILPNGKYEIANGCTNPPDSDPMWKSCVITHLVDHSTICQCTGLKDKNGKLIWENDIVREISSLNFERDKAKVSWIESEWMFEWKSKLFYRQDMKFWTSERIIEVIGNIFDNPELLQ